MADENPPRLTTRSQTNGTPSETANGRPVRNRRQAAIHNIGTFDGRAPLPPTPSRAAVAAGAAAPLPDTPAAAARTRPGPPLGQPQKRPEDMSKAFAHFLIDPEVAGMGFKTAIRHADGRHAAAGGAPEEYNSLADRRKRYLRNPRVVEIAEEIVRADVLERLAREGGNSDALTDAENHSLATIRRTEPTFGAEAGGGRELGQIWPRARPNRKPCLVPRHAPLIASSVVALVSGAPPVGQLGQLGHMRWGWGWGRNYEAS